MGKRRESKFFPIGGCSGIHDDTGPDWPVSYPVGKVKIRTHLLLYFGLKRYPP